MFNQLVDDQIVDRALPLYSSRLLQSREQRENLEQFEQFVIFFRRKSVTDI
jgi:hypothetical protein